MRGGDIAAEVIVGGVGEEQHIDELERALRVARPRVIGIASAFVSVRGVERALEVVRRCGEPGCRLIAGTDHAITHPEALSLAACAGWEVRLARGPMGVFHPKLIVGGTRFGRGGLIRDVCFLFVGSANLTDGGLRTNVECSLVASGDEMVRGAAEAFSRFWSMSTRADDAALTHYAAAFADRNRGRSPSELEALGVTDGQAMNNHSRRQLLRQRPPRTAAIRTVYAEAAWTGLQSFTGEFRFQVEFPRAAGEVVHRLIQGYARPDGYVDVYCASDETTRSMQFRFYTDNSMFRLNVPNDLPGVQWARENRDGLALVERGPTGGAPIRLTVHRSGALTDEVIARSVALGTWARTTTRLYGWF